MTVRFGVVGCGRVAGHHLEFLSRLPRAEIAAVCDILPDRAARFAERYGVPMYTNYHTMLRRERIDVIDLLTPSGMHPAHAEDIMRRYAKHVVIEKPMALDVTDLDRLARAADETGARIYPVYQNRYNRAVQRVRQDLEAGAFGRLLLGTVRVRWCRLREYYASDPWRGTWALDGGALSNQGIHYVDLLLYLLGDVESVYARTATQLAPVEVEDTVVAVVKFVSGALGVIEVTTAARPDDFEASISVLGEKGTAIISGIAANELSTYTLEPQAGRDHSEVFPNAYGFGHRSLFRDVVANLLDNQPFPITFADASRALRLLSAVYRSAEDDGPVRMADAPLSRMLGRHDAALMARYLVYPETDGTEA